MCNYLPPLCTTLGDNTALYHRQQHLPSSFDNTRSISPEERILTYTCSQPLLQTSPGHILNSAGRKEQGSFLFQQNKDYLSQLFTRHSPGIAAPFFTAPSQHPGFRPRTLVPNLSFLLPTPSSVAVGTCLSKSRLWLSVSACQTSF